MNNRTDALVGDGAGLDDEQLELLRREVTEEAMSIHFALEEGGRWRSPQDCWVEARSLVMARHRS